MPKDKDELLELEELMLDDELELDDELMLDDELLLDEDDELLELIKAEYNVSSFVPSSEISRPSTSTPSSTKRLYFSVPR
jgi:hypothetical protein